MSNEPGRGQLAAIIGAAIVSVVAVVLASVALGSSGDDPAQPVAAARPSIATSGDGTTTAVPDQLSFDVHVTLTRPDVATAMKDASNTMRKVFAAVSGQGVLRHDMQSTGLSIQPSYDYSNNTERLVGYTVSQRARVQVDDLTKAGKTLSVAAAAGGNDVRINGVALGLSNQRALLVRARKAAVADARAKATEYAEAGGARLGRLLSLKEVGAATPYSQRLAYAADVAGRIPTRASVPIRAGQKGLEVRIQAVWELD